jgi:cation diffusion facilitator family transporter
MNELEDRRKVIVRTSVIGIAANVLLAAFKALIGMATHSVAITMDAVNNLSDAMSSIITIGGTKLADRAPDKEHPLGHGRYEYLTAMVISVIIMYAGVTSLIESVKKIINPVKPEYTNTALIIVAVAVAVKIVLGRYVKRTGEKVNSGSLIASGSDATLDAVISASTLVAAFIYIGTGLSLEAWLGAVIAVVIIKAGIDMSRETISQILGERVESDLSRGIKETVSSFDGVYGAYDLLLHNYGPDTLVGSVHIEVPDSYTADMIDDLTRRIQKKVFHDYHVILATVGIYSKNTKDDFAAKVRDDVTEIVMSHDHVMQLHGFYLDEESKTMQFDIIVDFAADDREAVYDHIRNEINSLYPEYKLRITLDTDVSD